MSDLEHPLDVSLLLLAPLRLEAYQYVTILYQRRLNTHLVDL